MKLYEPKTIRYIKDKYGFRFSKNLGQNFLTDKNIIDKIVDGAEIESEDTVLEIGPGIGVITCEAAGKAGCCGLSYRNEARMRDRRFGIDRRSVCHRARI